MVNGQPNSLWVSLIGRHPPSHCHHLTIRSVTNLRPPTLAPSQQAHLRYRGIMAFVPADQNMPMITARCVLSLLSRSYCSDLISPIMATCRNTRNQQTTRRSVGWSSRYGSVTRLAPCKHPRRLSFLAPQSQASSFVNSGRPLSYRPCDMDGFAGSLLKTRRRGVRCRVSPWRVSS